jgi:hypothetical protein
MKAGVWNLGFGLIAIAAGASGKYALPGTSNPMYLVAAGVVVAGLGVFQLWRNRGR